MEHTTLSPAVNAQINFLMDKMPQSDVKLLRANNGAKDFEVTYKPAALTSFMRKVTGFVMVLLGALTFTLLLRIKSYDDTATNLLKDRPVMHVTPTFAERAKALRTVQLENMGMDAFKSSLSEARAAKAQAAQMNATSSRTTEFRRDAAGINAKARSSAAAADTPATSMSTSTKLFGAAAGAAALFALRALTRR